MKKSLGARAYVCTTPVWVIGSYDEDGKANIMTASWGGIVCSDPPCVGVSLRKATCTFGNISRRQAFTVGIPGQRNLREADFIGIVTGRKHDKFKEAGLTEVRSELVDAPYVQEFPVVLECRLLQTVPLGLHTQFVGEILDVKAEEELLGPDGFPDLLRISPFLFVPGQEIYCRVGEQIARAFEVADLKA